jgi:peptidyl-prolyl cis-trans isomerase B (cyclophilin B)
MSATRIKILAPLSLLALLLFIAGCGGDDSSSETTTAGGCTPAEAPSAKDVELKAPTESAPTASDVVFETNCGSFTVKLDSTTNPKTAASFQYLAEQGAYDDTSINRIAPGFVIQGGDPTETQAGDAGYTITETPPSKVVYRNGLVAMAKGSVDPPGTSGSQFFIVTAPADAGLPPDYAVVGEISAGEDTVKKIEAIGTDAAANDGPPSEPVVIQSATAED